MYRHDDCIVPGIFFFSHEKSTPYATTIAYHFHGSVIPVSCPFNEHRTSTLYWHGTHATYVRVLVCTLPSLCARPHCFVSEHEPDTTCTITDATALLALIQHIEDDIRLGHARSVGLSDGLLESLRGSRNQRIRTHNPDMHPKDDNTGPMSMNALDAAVQSFLVHQFDWFDILPKGCPSDAVALLCYKYLLQCSLPHTQWTLSYCLLGVDPSHHWWSWDGRVALDETEMKRFISVIVAHAIHQQLRLQIPPTASHRMPRHRMAAGVLLTARTILIRSLCQHTEQRVCLVRVHTPAICFNQELVFGID
jgi:hypothetical protein